MELKLFLYIILSENYGRIKIIFSKKYKKHINIYAFVYIYLTTAKQKFYIELTGVLLGPGSREK